MPICLNLQGGSRNTVVICPSCLVLQQLSLRKQCSHHLLSGIGLFTALSSIRALSFEALSKRGQTVLLSQVDTPQSRTSCSTAHTSLVWSDGMISTLIQMATEEADSMCQVSCCWIEPASRLNSVGSKNACWASACLLVALALRINCFWRACYLSVRMEMIEPTWLCTMYCYMYM